MRVLAQGVFDVLHPGHIHYLRESAALGDELVVIVARDATAHNRPLLMGEEDRLVMVQALEMVDDAMLGSETDMFENVERLDPDVITLGYDQPFDEDELENVLRGRGLDHVDLIRIGEYDGDIVSSSEIRARISKR